MELARKRPGTTRFASAPTKPHSQGLIYFWIDTCCIDKRNSAELSEAINSMFKWYRNAARCYVYMPDVPATSPWEPALRASRWFTVVWTLQGAPRSSVGSNFFFCARSYATWR